MDFIEVISGEEFDVIGKLIVLGFIDVYVYFCELGGEYKEIILIGI